MNFIVDDYYDLQTRIIMSSFYTISSSPTFTSTIPTSLPPSPEASLTIDDYLLYADSQSNTLVVIDLMKKTQFKTNQTSHEDKGRNSKNWWYIAIPNNLPPLQNVTHLLPVASHLVNLSSEENHRLVLLTNSFICYIQLNNSLTKIIAGTCYHLLYQPHNPIEIQNNLANHSRSLNNQQILFINKKKQEEKTSQWILIVVGFDQNYRVLGNIYQINISKKENNDNICLIAHFSLQVPQSLKNIYQCSFTLTCSHPSYPVLFLYQIFNQKGLALSIHPYILEPLLYLKEPATTVIKPEQKYELFSLHNHYHIIAIHQEGEDLYVCYRRYVPFNKNMEENEALAHVWVYNLSQGYTRNIIDLKGFVTSTKILQYSENNIIIKSFSIVANTEKSGTNRISYIKMDSSAYHPKFEINNGLEELICESEEYLITLAPEEKTLNPKHVSIYPKIKKNTIYCKMWEKLNLIEGQAILQYIMSML